MTLIGGRVITPGGVGDGWVETHGERIAEVGRGRPPRKAAGNRTWTIVPGFVDVHVHGGGGHSVIAGDPAAIIGAANFHRGHGTTTTLVSLVTAPADELIAATKRIAEYLDSSSPDVRRRIAGIHLEGPFLSAARCGAQNPAHMTDPDPAVVDELLTAANGHLRVVTLAPERPGALDAIRRFVGAGVIAAIGHTDATFDETAAAVAAGATLATHLGNAMSPLHHRDPGAVGSCLSSPAVVCELIVDGHHLHPAFVRLAAMTKREDAFVLITDAIAAAGAGDGRYVLGALDVDVVDGVARLADAQALAGSTLTMDAAFRNALRCGLDESHVSRAASLNPARLLGGDDEVGSIEVGKRGDLVVLDDELGVAAVVAGGEVVSGSLE
jgi:N-acetylglucosamine-6-phosphate deacetylase